MASMYTQICIHLHTHMSTYIPIHQVQIPVLPPILQVPILWAQDPGIGMVLEGMLRPTQYCRSRGLAPGSKASEDAVLSGCHT